MSDFRSQFLVINTLEQATSFHIARLVHFILIG